jgi:hypothetical protein
MLREYESSEKKERKEEEIEETNPIQLIILSKIDEKEREEQDKKIIKDMDPEYKVFPDEDYVYRHDIIQVNSENIQILKLTINNDDKIFKNEKVLFTLSLDGSQSTSDSFEWINKTRNINDSNLLSVYVFYKKYKDIMNFSNKQENVLAKYSALSYNNYDNSKILLVDKEKKNHHLYQVHKIAMENKSKFIVCGYQGLKGPRGDNKQLDTAIDLILGYVRLPIIIIKEGILKQNKKGNNWLFLFDRQYLGSFKTINYFADLIDKENDSVNALVLMPHWVYYEDVKDQCVDVFNKKGIFNINYEVIEYDKNPSKTITDKINFGEINYDFLVFYNNLTKYTSEKELSESYKLLYKTNTNICILNEY